MTHHEPTIAAILRQLAGEYHGPVEERRVLERVLEQRPSNAKNPFATIRERLRWDGLALGWLRLGRGQLMPLHIALHGLRFRCLPRDEDLGNGMLPLAHLLPFCGTRGMNFTLQDAWGRPLEFISLKPDEPHMNGMPAFAMNQWYSKVGFRSGDSIIVTVTRSDPLVLTMTRERREDFSASAVAKQDAELLEAILQRTQRTQSTLAPCDEIVLPIFATAPWRSAYPGTPWQHLVLRDERLTLVDDIFLTNQPLGALKLFNCAEVFEPPPRAADADEARDRALLAQIEALQHELHRARERDAEAGLWNGQVQRASATFGGFSEDDTNQHHLFDQLEDELVGGDWELDDDWDDDDDFDQPEGVVVDQATLQAAHERMLQLLPPETIARLNQARDEEAEVIIAQHLNMLLARAPDLFPRINILPITNEDETFESSFFGDWVEDDWDEDYDGNFDHFEDLFEDTNTSVSLDQSSDLIAQFYDYLLEMGKTSTTARARSRALKIYAEFLASYYGRTLAQGDYATLDECLFFYYPRRVNKTSERQVRDLCTALKQFYAFLIQRGVIEDDRFAEALWRRRDQVVRVVELYDQMTGDSPSFELLFERLFLPYTE
ncbi:hypothetical protein [Candidatus Viridilinea mediisalina]|uniref:Core-binding (CB) domain-containing protein n=1 Tax=Candidatus Viridilinea mediisalina TaxID=2024553 RepID=A0A2A6RP75_9CHLR|nr:hypothetical protein [Candidatus Viridilinea mediisalina]PDW04862.1 hypothetical protein CJ255_01250 [Candidatus Viridilinea mediisalina]